MLLLTMRRTLNWLHIAHLDTAVEGEVGLVADADEVVVVVVGGAHVAERVQRGVPFLFRRKLRKAVRPVELGTSLSQSHGRQKFAVFNEELPSQKCKRRFTVQLLFFFYGPPPKAHARELERLGLFDRALTIGP
jgi:hypothetical protein